MIIGNVNEVLNDIVVQVSIAPQDFVSVPVDYNGMKARVCKYKVLSKKWRLYEF